MAVTRNGKPFDGGRIHSDADEQPDTLAVGDVKLILLKRGERFAVRIKDNQSPLRAELRRPALVSAAREWRIQAKFVPYPAPTKLKMDTIVGETEAVDSPGLCDLRARREDLSPRGGESEERHALVRLSRRHQRADDSRRCPAALRRSSRGRESSCSTSTRRSTCRVRTFRTRPARSRRRRTG